MAKISDKTKNVMTVKASVCSKGEGRREVVHEAPVVEELGDEDFDTLFVLPGHPRRIPEMEGDVSRQVFIGYRGEDKDEDSVSGYYLSGVVVYQDLEVARVLGGETVDSE